MRRVLLLTVFIVSLCFLNSTLREVSLDGTHSYISIQSAVDDANNGDIIHVYPGRYFEHIDILEKTVTLRSQYGITNNWDDVLNTIIDADSQSNCIRIEDNCTVLLNGFVLTNGIGFSYGDDVSYGGGISINNECDVDIVNCIIENNYGMYNGGVLCNNGSTVSLSNNTIRNNRAIYWGGGLGVKNGDIIFDQSNLNSIYNNYSIVQDIYLQFSTSTDIILDTLSITLDEPDGYFVSYYHDDGSSPPAVSAQNSWLTQIDADLYVSPLGNDNNDGLTPETALQTIAYANRIVQPNSLNPNTIHLLPGTYNTYNNQFFPISMQSHTKLLGTGSMIEEVTIGDIYGMNSVKLYMVENVEISKIRFTFSQAGTESTLGVGSCNRLYLHDMMFETNYNYIPGINLSSSSNCLIENVTIKNIQNNIDRLICIKTYECDNINFSNVIVNNVTNTNYDAFHHCVSFSRSDVTVNNMIISNCTTYGSGIIFQYSNPSYSYTYGNLELSNFIAYNNTAAYYWAHMPMFNFSTYHNECLLNNMTIANNTSPTAITRFGGDYAIRNSIIHNPEGGCEMSVWTPASGDTNPLWSNTDIDYSLVRNGISGVPGADNPNNNVLWGVNNIDANPMFRGDVEGDIPVGDPRWVQLTENSPCVNTGTPDTLGMNLPALDITGNPRVWGNIIDMGAHEYNPTVDVYNETAPTPLSSIQVSHFPNPVTPNGNNGKVAFIEFTLPKKPIERPTLEIYNIRGQKVIDIKITQSFSQLVRSAGLSSEDKQAGEYYSQVWDCKDNNRKSVASGIYFYKVSCEGSEAIGKMMVVK